MTKKYENPEIVKFSKTVFGIRCGNSDNGYCYLDICDAKEVSDQGERWITWHADNDNNEYSIGGDSFEFAQGNAKEVLASWKWLSSQGANTSQGVPISVAQLEKFAEKKPKAKPKSKPEEHPNG